MNGKKMAKNSILCLVGCAMYMLFAYVDRGYYAVGLEVFLPAFLWVAYLYAKEPDDPKNP